MRTLICSFVAGMTMSAALMAQAPGGKTDPRVKIQGAGVELVSVESGASQCRDSGNGMTVKFKVTSSSNIDIRFQITGPNIGAVTKEFANQASGSELSDYMCIPNAKYTVFVRPAGSSQAWPKK